MNGITVKLQTLRARINAIYDDENLPGQFFRAIPMLDEMNTLLDENDSQSPEALYEASKYYAYLGSCYKGLPFYPSALRCYVKAFSKFKRSIEGEISEDSYERARLCELFLEIMALRGRIYIDTATSESEFGAEYSILMKNLVGAREWEDLLCEAAKKSEAMAPLCRVAYTQQYYAALYEVECEAARKLDQLDPALVSPSSVSTLKAKLFAARGIEWTPSQI